MASTLLLFLALEEIADDTQKSHNRSCWPCIKATWNGVDYVYSKLSDCSCIRFKNEEDVTACLYKFFAIGIVTILTSRGLIELMNYYS
jgi:hypothetical protein